MLGDDFDFEALRMQNKIPKFCFCLQALRLQEGKYDPLCFASLVVGGDENNKKGFQRHKVYSAVA